jgi:hypothetical protein
MAYLQKGLTVIMRYVFKRRLFDIADVQVDVVTVMLVGIRSPVVSI